MIENEAFYDKNSSKETIDLKMLKILLYDEEADRIEAKTKKGWLYYMLRKCPEVGGYKYITVIASILCYQSFSISLNVSLLGPSFENDFKVSKAAISSFQGIEQGIICIFSAVFSRAIEYTGLRLNCTIGYILLILGVLLPSFLNNYYLIVVLYSVLSGSGSGSCQATAIQTPIDWFEEDGLVGTITGIILVAIGLGGVVFTYYMNYFLDNYDWRVCLHYSALLIAIFGIVCLFCLRQRTITSKKSEKLIEDELRQNLEYNNFDLKEIEEEIYNFRGKPIPFMDFSLLKHKRFTICLLVTVLTTFAFYVPYGTLIDDAMDKNLSLSDASFLLVIVGITNTLPRFLTGLFIDKYGPLIPLQTTCIIFFFSTLSQIFAKTNSHYYAIATFMGISMAINIVSVARAASAFVKPYQLAAGCGLFLGLGMLPGAALSGIVMGIFRDHFPNYNICLVIYTIFSFIATILVMYLIFYKPEENMIKNNSLQGEKLNNRPIYVSLDQMKSIVKNYSDAICEKRRGTCSSVQQV